MQLSEEQLWALLAEVCGSKEVLQHPLGLAGSGLLDSLAIITLFEELDLQGIPRQPTQLTKEELNSFNRLYARVSLVGWAETERNSRP